MVSIDGISLENFAQGHATCAAAFILREPASESLTLTVSQDWEVELKSGSKFVVVRTGSDFAESELLDQAIAAAHEGLDLAAVINLDPLTPDKRMDQYLLFEGSPAPRLQMQQFVNFGVIVGTPKLTVTRSNGTVETPTPRYPDWTPAFRFYRLSQVSSDLFEAYRNLFLGLEALLDLLCPKTSAEGERQWLIRSVNHLVPAGQLASIAISGAEGSPTSLVEWLYDVRLNLFHAKRGRTYVPEFTIGYATVANAYGPLMQLWRLIAETSLGARALGGALTHVAFKMGMEAGFAAAKLAVTADNTPVTKDDVGLSPRGEPVHIFADPLTVEPGKPGRMVVFSAIDLADTDIHELGRVGLLSEDDTLMVASDDYSRMEVAGVQTLEVRFVMRLLNKKQPRTEFP